MKGNLGISFIHEREAKEAIKENKVFKIDLVEEIPTRYVALVYDKNTEKKAVSVFLKLFLDYIK